MNTLHIFTLFILFLFTNELDARRRNATSNSLMFFIQKPNYGDLRIKSFYEQEVNNPFRLEVKPVLMTRKANNVIGSALILNDNNSKHKYNDKTNFRKMVNTRRYMAPIIRPSAANYDNTPKKYGPIYETYSDPPKQYYYYKEYKKYQDDHHDCRFCQIIDSIN